MLVTSFSPDSIPASRLRYGGRWRVFEDGWILVGTRKIEEQDLNAYGTLFGGHLLGEVLAGTNRFLETQAAGLTIRSMYDFLFESAVHAGERLLVVLRPRGIDGLKLSLECRVLCGPAAGSGPIRRIASCTMPAEAPWLPCHDPSGREGSFDLERDWHLTQSKWIIGGDCDGRQQLKVEELTALLDEAAVSFCRDFGQVGRFVTKKMVRFLLSDYIRLDDTVKVYFRLSGSGRTSLTVECAVVRTFSGTRGLVREQVAEASFIMVATDDTGKPIAHALSGGGGMGTSSYLPAQIPPAYMVAPSGALESSIRFQE